MRDVHILVVDDNRALRDNLVDIFAEGLSELRVDISCATTAREALTLAEAGTPELALLDLHLPDREATRVIAELQERAPHVQVVIVTGDSAVESAIDALEHGAFSYVLKPFKIPTLIKIARSGIERALLLREGDRLRGELEASERHHREVIESVPAFVLGLNQARQITLWNRQLETATGFDRSEMLGRPAEFLGPGGEARPLPTKTGRVLHARWRLAEVDASGPRSASTYAVGVDVTEERALEVRARRAERLAAVGTLAAGLAHEVRNPLNSASLQLEVLARKARKLDAEEELGPTIEIVEREIQRLDRLVSEFLSFARPAPLRLGDVALNAEIRAVAALLEPEAAAGAVRIRAELDPTLPLLQGEPERLRQVLLNLMRNAMEAMAGAGGELCVSTSHDGHNLTLVVADTGPGFAEDTPIFDAFFTTKHQGTGLGLAIVHRIVGDHGGSIGVSSRPGNTRFEIVLPLLTLERAER